VPSHADPSVYSLPVDTLSHNFPNALLHALAMLSTISLQPFHFAGALPALDWVPNCHSNPITQRVRRKRQRLPPSLLIENASGVSFRLPGNSLPEAFPIKASDHPPRGALALQVVSAMAISRQLRTTRDVSSRTLSPNSPAACFWVMYRCLTSCRTFSRSRSFADIHSPSVDSVMLHTSVQSGTFYVAKRGTSHVAASCPHFLLT